MDAPIACICGYRGPSVPADGGPVCPICRTPAARAESRLRIPCPNGHVLPVPETLLGQRVVCPKCNEFFQLTAEMSLEHRREAEHRRQEEESRQARLWLTRAIAAAALVIAALATLIALSLLRS
jgi:hypothetical protein